MIDIAKINGIGEWTLEERRDENGEVTDRIYRVTRDNGADSTGSDEGNGGDRGDGTDGGDGAGKAFLVIRPKTLEVRCERNLGRRLQDEYETVMESRYFGRGGIEIVPSGQLEEAELEDLVRLSYNLTAELRE